jgi:hypothetical protein
MFTKLAKIVAYLGLVLGTLRLVSAFWIATLPDEQRLQATRAYLGGGTTGSYIDQAFYVILFCIALGTVAEISQTLKRGVRD